MVSDRIQLFTPVPRPAHIDQATWDKHDALRQRMQLAVLRLTEKAISIGLEDLRETAIKTLFQAMFEDLTPDRTAKLMLLNPDHPTTTTLLVVAAAYDIPRADRVVHAGLCLVAIQDLIETRARVAELEAEVAFLRDNPNPPAVEITK
jgi:hypothetical protein